MSGGQHALSTEVGGGSAYTDEMARDAIGAALVEGTGIDITVNDGSDTITIAATGGGGGSAPDWLVDTEDQREYPATPDSLDDEFLSDDAKWTDVNDPSAPNSISFTAHPGYLWVGLPENTGTDNFDALVRRYQTPPAGTTSWSFIARIGISMATDGFQTDGGEFAGCWLYLGNSVNDEAVGVGIQFNIGALATPILTNVLLSTAGTLSGAGQAMSLALPGQMLWVKLTKAATTAYTSAQTYDCYVSADGLIWQHIAAQSKTFTTACNEIGVCFRSPKPGQVGSPVMHALVDSFRKTA